MSCLSQYGDLYFFGSVVEEKLGRIAAVHGEPRRLRWLGSHAYGFQAVGLALRLIQSDAELSSHYRIFWRPK